MRKAWRRWRTLGLIALCLPLLAAPSRSSLDDVHCGADPWATGFAAPATARDRSPALAALLRPGAADAVLAAHAEELDETTLVLVPGFLTDFLEDLRAIGLSEYLDAQAAALGPSMKEVVRVDLNSEASSATNAAAIAATLAAIEGPVCLLSHSKGGLDTLTYLTDATAEQRAQVRCWIALQAPFAGAPLADGTSNKFLPRLASKELLDLLGGEGAALDDMRSEVRGCFNARQDRRIAALSDEIAILSVAGALDSGDGLLEQLSLHLPGLVWLRLEGIRSDGLVPSGSAVLPHSDYAVIQGIDHTGISSSGSVGLSDLERRDLTRALLALALQGRGADRKRLKEFPK